MHFLYKLLEKRMEGESTVYCGKAAVSTLDSKRVFKVEFVETSAVNRFDALKVSIVNKFTGLVDSLTVKFSDVIGKKKGIDPHVWAPSGDWYVYVPTEMEICEILDIVFDYVSIFREVEE